MAGQGELERWLALAPGPPEREGRRYDAFISYRSSDRAWAMSLYDALKQAGWEPFLDQYELVPGEPLRQSLENGLSQSSSGVILWSSRTEDSAWCQREHNAMVQLHDRGGFRYLSAKIDAEELPLFLATDLYVDFVDSPDGPRGANLLRLMCGLRGVSLSPEAVELAQQVDANAEEQMVRIRAAVDAQNAAKLHVIGTSDEPGLLASAGPVTEAAVGLISLGELPMAIEVLERAAAHFPKSLRVRQLRGLAFRRMERFDDAIEVFSELYAAGHRDPETMGMYAAAWAGKYDEKGAVQALRKSRDLYRTAFEADPGNSYTGVNAAAKSLFLGEPEECERIASKVLPLVEEARNLEDFWNALTLAEVLLLRGQVDEAADLYQRTIDRYSSRTGDLAVSKKQVEKICSAHGLDASSTAKLLAAFPG